MYNHCNICNIQMKYTSEMHETYGAICHGVTENLDQHLAAMQMWACAPLTNRQAAWLALHLAKRLSQSVKAATRQAACGRG
jgi:hypothetical protein